MTMTTLILCCACVTLENKKKVCVDPDAKWVQVLITAKKGVPIPGAQGRCQCIQTSSDVIRPKVIQSLKYIPRGSHCEKAEIIVTLKNKKKVCVDPDAKWLQVLITAEKGAKKHN
ncbi:interleukin-8-like isoform X2 [Pristis pectinata]|uniref:interleukin-8-like isoform X2 n=1 Tax=Pristis pectinata TaxID=685728 RepID=UPI00223E08BD|nr:interleukin-8-like isoform X2 [Pristis pectinata]